MKPGALSDELLQALSEGLHGLSNKLALAVGTMEMVASSRVVPGSLRSMAEAALEDLTEAASIMARMQRAVEQSGAVPGCRPAETGRPQPAPRCE